MKSRGQKRRQARLTIEKKANKLHYKEGISRSEAKKQIRNTLERTEKVKLLSNCEIVRPKKKTQNMSKVFNRFRKGLINGEQVRTLRELKIHVHKNMTEKEALKLLKSK